MKRLLVVATVAGLFIAALATPALADRPLEVTESTTFEDLNPCDAPNTHEITLVFNLKIHEHRNNFVLVVNTTASTDDGFEGFGHETTVEPNANTFSSTLNFVQTHPETGEKFTVKAHFTFANGEVRVDNFKFNCVIDR